MKKIISILLILFYLVSFSSVTFAQATPKVTTKVIPIYLNGTKIKFDINPVESSNRILVPFRAVAEAIGSSVEWNATHKSVYAKSLDGLTNIKLTVNNKVANINDMPVSLDVPTKEFQGRVLLPLRFFSEAMGCNVVWDPAIYGVRITSPAKALDDIYYYEENMPNMESGNIKEEKISSTKAYVLGFYALGSKNASSWKDVFGKEYPETSAGNTDVISELAFGWYSLDERGNLLMQNNYTGWKRPDGWETALEQAGNYNLKSQITVQIVEDKNQTLSKFLSDEMAMDNAINQIIAEAKHFQAINLDMEQWGNIYKEKDLIKSQQKLNGFVTKISEKAKANNLKLVLSVHPLNSSYRGYDYTVLSQLSDEIVIMAYEYQTGVTEPTDKVLQAVEQAIQLVPKDKLVLGINIPKETPQTLIEKVNIAKKHSLKGIALWRLGLISGEMWASIKASLYTPE